MRHLDLFSGIGGFALAAQWVWGEEHEVVAFCEIDKFCQKVLKMHWPNVNIIEDIRNVTKETLAHTSSANAWSNPELTESPESSHRESSFLLPDSGSGSREDTTGNYNRRIDLLTGGFPCQPFSCAGKREGTEDKQGRYLWPEMLRVISEIHPTWVIAENVGGLLTLQDGVVFEHCCSDLEKEGYEVQPFVIPACAVNAPHRRDRVWIVANNEMFGQSRSSINGWRKKGTDFAEYQSMVSYNQTKRLQGKWPGGEQVPHPHEQQGLSMCCCESHRNQWSVEPNVGRVANGVPFRVDRLKSLGNAIVPQVAVEIMKAIKMVDHHAHIMDTGSEDETLA